MEGRAKILISKYQILNHIWFIMQMSTCHRKKTKKTPRTLYPSLLKIWISRSKCQLLRHVRYIGKSSQNKWTQSREAEGDWILDCLRSQSPFALRLRALIIFLFIPTPRSSSQARTLSVWALHNRPSQAPDSHTIHDAITSLTCAHA